MAALIAKKQEEWNSQKVRDLLRLPENKKCFDCPTKSPFFVNVSIQTFVCTRCSGLVREVGHRVKSISASKFSGPEIVALQHGGNEVARTIWLSNYNMNTAEPESDGDVRLFMRQKYYEQKWLDRKKGVAHAERVKRIITETYNEDGVRRVPSPKVAKRQSLNVATTTERPKIVPTQSWVDDNVPIGLIPTVKTNATTVDLLLNDDLMLSPKSPTFPSPPQPSHSTSRGLPIAPLASAPQSQPSQKPTPAAAMQPAKNDFFSELAALNPVKPVATATYSGGILQPNSPSTSSPRTSNFQIPTPTSPITPQKTAVTTTNNNNSKSIDLDPYAALRDLSIGSKPVTPPPMTKMESNDSLTFGDFQKSPTTATFTAFKTTPTNNALFGDLDPLFKQ
ncbi:hypothetical protein V8B55DRAFT_1478630 [Mucor lusitanicus]|uniref:Arf-GAP domain-containing protein n=1 Tax=Mucor lusitanicus CBS 277.49 TaxID=747725 RepID=A0A168H9D5_MUCCL|nr:hypothetical protein MUCCIDRAFT_191221 [Mucor lusitanicus CBS 277.49]